MKGAPVQMIDKIRTELEKETKKLEYELRVKLPKEIGKALEMGDLRENAEYKAALERQEFLRTRIGSLNKRIAELSTLNLSSIPKGRVAYGSTVRLFNLETEEEITYRLVVSEEADFERGWISLTSPIGQALRGKKEGDTTVVQTPAGKKQYEISELRTLHDED
jgi:transcription elongation factor GreA